MRQLFLLFGLFFFINPIHAQNEQMPLIALSEGAIYAVDPSDGSAEILVPAPDDYEELREIYGEVITFFSADWLSPDGQYLAYRMLFPLHPNEPVTENSDFVQQLFILDLANGNISNQLDLGIAEPYAIESLAWSLNASSLYVLVHINRENQPWSLLVLERESWELLTTINLSDPGFSVTRQIFAIEDAVVLVDRQNSDHATISFIVINLETGRQNRFELTSNQVPLFNERYNLFVPCLIDGKLQYTFIDSSSYIVNTLDFSSGGLSELGMGEYEAVMVSRWNPATSLRLSISSVGQLTISDADYIPGAVASVEHNFPGMIRTFALSPDGQSFVYLSPDDESMIIWNSGETRSLNFAAQVVVWASPLFISSHNPAQG